MEKRTKRGKLLTTKQVANWLSISPRQVLRLPIPRVMIGARNVRYHEEDVLAYIEGHEFSPGRAE